MSHRWLTVTHSWLIGQVYCIQSAVSAMQIDKDVCKHKQSREFERARYLIPSIDLYLNVCWQMFAWVQACIPTTCVRTLQYSHVCKHPPPLLWDGPALQDMYLYWHMVIAASWDSAGAAGWGVGTFVSCMWKAKLDHFFFKSDEGAVWVDGSGGNYILSNPIPHALLPPFLLPVMTAERLTCHGSSHFQESVRSLLHYPALLLLQHHVGKGWYQLVPGEDRGRTGSVRVHRLSGGHLRQRCASAPAPATLPLINGPGPDNWS